MPYVFVLSGVRTLSSLKKLLKQRWKMFDPTACRRHYFQADLILSDSPFKFIIVLPHFSEKSPASMLDLEALWLGKKTQL